MKIKETEKDKIGSLTKRPSSRTQTPFVTPAGTLTCRAFLEMGKENQGANVNVRCICRICATSSGTPIVLKCFHRFCSKCLELKLMKGIADHKIDMKCPSSDCFFELAPSDVHRVLSKESFQKFKMLCFKMFDSDDTPRFFYCPTYGCSNLFDKIKCYANDHIDCPKCKQMHCLKCYQNSNKCECPK